MAQDFFAAFGNDGVGTIGTPTTINSGDMAGILMIAVQALEKRAGDLKRLEAENADLKARLESLEGKVYRALTCSYRCSRRSHGAQLHPGYGSRYQGPQAHSAPFSRQRGVLYRSA
jgi:hypothetical protein